ncbi:branched-chain-amino-acid aminotransferase 5, chloroplastic-like [Dorcoceras hygrometricum]|uniref:Branched-chain-amino-acid aminotransferase 5, chloroplastic-like n=1 Tax=Dorcoceras hygrometricum TaxID=472368 RepID=A0A2Z7BWD0_9LAMI|nr:branched-chain-amino-acid aminotransferase 5, chloroplastic-like [Dorcoceras hygrometricum]
MEKGSKKKMNSGALTRDGISNDDVSLSVEEAGGSNRDVIISITEAVGTIIEAVNSLCIEEWSRSCQQLANQLKERLLTTVGVESVDGLCEGDNQQAATVHPDESYSDIINQSRMHSKRCRLNKLIRHRLI